MKQAYDSRYSCFPRRFVLSVALSGLLVLAGCAGSGTSTSSVSSSVSGKPASGKPVSDKGTVAAVRSINLHEDRASESAARVTTSEATASLDPSHTSSPSYAGRGRTLSMVGGAALGSLAGDNTDDLPGVRDGLEITVHLDGGGSRTVVQQADQSIRLNQRVVIVSGTGPTRVQPD